MNIPADYDYNLDRVLSEPASADFLNISLPHLRRLRYSGKGPEYVQLSERRIGYRIRRLIAYLDARTVGANNGTR